MNASLFLPDREEPVAVLDDVQVIEFNDNHTAAPVRIFYKSQKLNASKVMMELRRDEPMTVRLEDGRSGRVVLQHTSMDTAGNAVGVLRLVGALQA
jgi:hypothetical protein